MLLNEADRCLNCKKPLCKINCPISTEIPEIIELFKEGRLKEAGSRLFENNPLSLFCSIVCPHEDQCRGNCIRGIKGEPVDFPKIERFISNNYLKELPMDKKRARDIEIAIVGGGVAGITSAILLAREGFSITLFESFSKLGGVLRYGIPDFRLPREYVDRFEEYLKELGVSNKYNSCVGIDYSIEELKNDGFKYIILSNGLWKAKKMGVAGESRKNIYFAINYLKSPKSFVLGDEVLVIGGGNVAMDTARTAKRMASNVTIVYRRTEKDMPASKEEIEDTKGDGVKFLFKHTPKEILENKMSFENEGELKELNYSSVIVAIGQEAREDIKGIECEKNGLIKVNERYETDIEGVYACGDIVTGAKTVVLAVKNAKNLVNEILKKEKTSIL